MQHNLFNASFGVASPSSNIAAADAWRLVDDGRYSDRRYDDDEPSLIDSYQLISKLLQDEVIGTAPGRVPWERFAIAGFSQGA